MLSPFRLLIPLRGRPVGHPHALPFGMTVVELAILGVARNDGFAYAIDLLPFAFALFVLDVV